MSIKSTILNTQSMLVYDKDSSGTNIEFVPFKINCPVTESEMFTNSVKELIWRTSDGTDVRNLLFSSDMCIPGALDIAIEGIKGAMHVIAAILFGEKSNAFYPIKVDHNDESAPKSLSEDEICLRQFTDSISIYWTSSKECRGLVYASVSWNKIKILESGESECVASPIQIDVSIPLRDVDDVTRDRTIYDRGDISYCVKCVSNVGEVGDGGKFAKLFGKQFEEALESAYKLFAKTIIKDSKDSKDTICGQCPRAKSFDDDCFVNNDSVDVETAMDVLEETVVHLQHNEYEDDDCFEVQSQFIITDKIIYNLRPRSEHMARLITETGLAIFDYLTSIAPVEEEKEIDDDSNYTPVDESKVVNSAAE